MKLRLILTTLTVLLAQVVIGQSPDGDLFIDRFLGSLQARTPLLISGQPLGDGLARPLVLANLPQYWISGVSTNLMQNQPSGDYEKLFGSVSVPLQWANRTGRNSGKHFFNEYNLSQSSSGDGTVNYRAQQVVNSRFSLQLLANGLRNRGNSDGNKDGWLDRLQKDRAMMFLKTNYRIRNVSNQLNVFYLDLNEWGGAVDFDRNTHQGTTAQYGLGTRATHLGVAGTSSTPLKTKHDLALTYVAEKHQQNRFWGMRTYSGQQERAGAGLAYRNTQRMHTTAVGINADYDRVAESLDSLHLGRTERSVGAWLQYRTQYGNKLRFTATGRADYHNLFHWLISPHAVAEYQPYKPLHFTAFSQFGSRYPNFFTENAALFNSARELRWNYEMRPEQAWRTGISASYKPGNFWLFQGVLTRTDFTDRLVLDVFADPATISVYDLNGQSTEHQLDLRARWRANGNRGGLLGDRNGNTLLGVETVYRYSLAQIEYAGGMQQAPFVAPHQLFVRGFYNLKGVVIHAVGWRASKMPIPLAAGIPVNGHNHTTAPARHQLDLRVDIPLISKPILMVYAGVDNVTGFKQNTPVVAADQPFSKDFDAGLQWGPVTGAKWFGGVSFQF